MPSIKLKKSSPEFIESSTDVGSLECDHPGCISAGPFRAPKHRGLNDHYNFCLAHVQEYNKGWNFFSGMNDEEIRSHLEKDRYGNRPTWKYATYAEAEEFVRQKSWSEFRGKQHEEETHQEQRRAKQDIQDRDETEFKAMAIMGIAPPITFPEIKHAYRQLVKKFHPDANHGCIKSEDRLKEINMAYTVLKGAFEKYEKLKK